MDDMNIREARKNLCKLIKSAERGRSTIITRRGRKVARIDPLGSDRKASLPDLTEFRASVKWKEKKLSATVIDQRKKERY
jgi:prevent-host-death family protein